MKSIRLGKTALNGCAKLSWLLTFRSSADDLIGLGLVCLIHELLDVSICELLSSSIRKTNAHHHFLITCLRFFNLFLPKIVLCLRDLAVWKFQAFVQNTKLLIKVKNKWLYEWLFIHQYVLQALWDYLMPVSGYRSIQTRNNIPQTFWS